MEYNQMIEDKKRELLEKKLDDTFFSYFLPLVHSKNNYSQSFLDENPYGLRLWENSNKVLISLQPPALVKEDPKAKPERLGRVMKRLAWCYRQPLSKKIKMAKRVLNDTFRATDKLAVAFSGGKDSLVALHLALQLKPDIPVLFVNTGIEFPESLEYIEQLKEDWKLNNFYEANAKVNFWRLTEEQGLPVAGRGNTTFMSDLSEQAGVKLSNSCCHRMKETPARQFYREHKTEGVVTGLRVSESMMRKMNFADYGALRYSSTYGTLISWPLYAWLDDDIFNYIDRYELPQNPIYEMGYKRVGCWACLQDMFYKDSRLFTLQKEHPNMYKTIRKKFGKQMANLLKVWADLEDRNFTEEQLLEGLYRECEFDMLNERHKEKKKAEKLKKQQLENA